MAYLKEAAAENGIDKHIRYGQKVVAADWSDADNRWTLRVERDGERASRSTARSCSRCSGYYNYDEGYSPEFAGSEDFEGTIVHPQHWPEDLDYQGKKIVVIGSGATAVTLIPALDRLGRRSRDDAAALADLHRRAARRRPVRRAGQQAAAREGRLRRQPVEGHPAPARRSTRSPGSFPKFMRKTLLTMAERRLPEGYDVRQALRPELQPVGPAAVPGAQRRSVQDHPQGQGRRRHRHHRAVHQDRHQADLR